MCDFPTHPFCLFGGLVCFCVGEGSDPKQQNGRCVWRKGTCECYEVGVAAGVGVSVPL